MKVEFPRTDVLVNIHGRLIKQYSGLSGIRDRGLLESAVARPENLHAYVEDTPIPALAASLGWAILRNRPFADGNKRTAFAGLTLFLELNGYRLRCSEVEETAMVLRAVASEIDEAAWTAWVERSVGRL